MSVKPLTGRCWPAHGSNMPVHAFRYNWLASSHGFRQETLIEKCWSSANESCLVTHSMGGLIARMCATAAICGIIHGMPTNGAGLQALRDWHAR